MKEDNMTEKKVVKFNLILEDAKLFNDSGRITVTSLFRNECYSRGTNLFVLAIHDDSLFQEKKYLCKKNWPTVDCSTDCENYSENCEFRKEQLLPIKIEGTYSIHLRKKDGGLPVIHLNRISDEIEPNYVWINKSTGTSRHDNSHYTLISDEDIETVFENCTYSGGGAHQNSVLIGFVPIGSKIKFYCDSYKHRRGDAVYYYTIDSTGNLNELPVELADGITLEDVLSPPVEE